MDFTNLPPQLPNVLIPPNNILSFDDNMRVLNTGISSSIEQQLDILNSIWLPPIIQESAANIQLHDIGHNQDPLSPSYDASHAQTEGGGNILCCNRPEKRKYDAESNGEQNTCCTCKKSGCLKWNRMDFTNLPPQLPNVPIPPNNILSFDNNMRVLNTGIATSISQQLDILNSIWLPPIIQESAANIQSHDIGHNQDPLSPSYDASHAQTEGVGNVSIYRYDAENNGGNDQNTCCTCKKSGCLKCYCLCFASANYCINACSCQGCHNLPCYEPEVSDACAEIQLGNPLAFVPEVISATTPVRGENMETNQASTSARHKKGCNCKKSNCGNNYCVCHAAKIRCSELCRCVGCQNCHGKKDENKTESTDDSIQAFFKSGLANEEDNTLSSIVGEPSP